MVIYACWGGLSNRPARGTLIACSGSGDCGGQMQGETCGGLVAEGRVGPRRVVVGHPGGDQVAGMGEVSEQRFVEKFVPHPAVETLDEPILHRLSRRDVVPLDLGLGAPLQDRIRGQFGPVVGDDHPGLAAPFDQRRQLPCHAAARDRGVGDRSEALARDVIHHIQHPEPPSAGELIVDEIQRPAGVCTGFDQDRGPCAKRFAARFAFTDG